MREITDGITQGLFGNYSEVSVEELQKKFGNYLMEEEVIENGFKLVRDTLIFTNLRILDFDKQGATGKKTRIESIYLDTICEVTCETAGMGIDDSEITITYIRSPYKIQRTHPRPQDFRIPQKIRRRRSLRPTRNPRPQQRPKTQRVVFKGMGVFP